MAQNFAWLEEVAPPERPRPAAGREVPVLGDGEPWFLNMVR